MPVRMRCREFIHSAGIQSGRGSRPSTPPGMGKTTRRDFRRGNERKTESLELCEPAAVSGVQFGKHLQVFSMGDGTATAVGVEAQKPAAAKPPRGGNVQQVQC